MRYDVIVIGGGLAGITVAGSILKAGKKVAVVSAGRSIHNVDYRAFEHAGGALMMGSKAVSATFDGNALKNVVTDTLGPDFPLEASVFVLATGKFFGGGLVSDMNTVREPLLGCDVDMPCAQAEWTDADFYADHAFLKFGVRTDASGRVMRCGVPIVNVFAAGEILAGISPADPSSDEKIESGAKLSAESILEMI